MRDRNKQREYQRQWCRDNAGRINAATARWREQNPNWARNMHLKQRYKITEVDFQNLWDAQMGECANDACGNTFSSKSDAHIDHDHRYGNNWWAVRGLLCGKCNKALGLLSDDPVRIAGLAAYVGA